MGQFNNAGSFPAFLQPTQNKELYNGNYLNFTESGHNQWAQQFMPDLYKKIAPKYGSNQTIAGFLSMITNGEMSANSDQIIWQEEGRLHTRYEKLWADSSAANPVAADGTFTAASATSTVVAGEGFIAFTLGTNQAGPGQYLTDGSDDQFGPLAQQNAFSASNADLNYLQPNINFRVGQTAMVQVEGSTGSAIKGVVTAVSGKSFVLAVYNTSAVLASAAAVTYTALVYGSEFGKGTGNFTEKKDSEYSTYANQLIILKEHYSINGTDLSQIGWIDTGEGYLWYHKSKSDNMKLWNDYMEMALVEGVVAEGTLAGRNLPNGRGDYRADSGAGSAVGITQAARGTEGFFQSLEKRGNIYQGFGDEAAGGGALTDFDNLLKQLDKQGSIEENMIYTDRDLSLEIDDILAQQNSYGAGGTSWGAFNNSEKMALDLGFSGFRRGSYDFYKTDWRYLNDHSTRGGFNDIEGVLIPAGTSTVYEKFGNGKVKRPFLHVRYREGRKMKNWMTGGAGGASTSDIDEVRHHYLTERCLITQAANNFVLFKK